MIQINLLGIPKPKKGKRAAAVSMPGEGPNPILVIGLAVVLSILALGGWYVKLQRDAQQITQKMQEAQKEAQRLAVAKAKYEERMAQKQNLDKRKQVIDELKAKQLGPVELLAKVGDTINETDGVWLEQMKEEGRNVNIEGMALSVHQVANLMKALQKTGLFKSVELKDTSQDDKVKEMQAFTFILQCEKADPKQPEMAGGVPADKKM